MKIKCDFCKTEYSVDKSPTTPVKCAVCGHVWTATTPTHRGAWMMFIASLCALLSAAVFATAVIVRSKIENANKQPIVAQLTEIKTVTDDNGVPRFSVRGAIINQSTEIYGVPDLVVVSRDASGREIARQKFMPSATLVEAGASVEFYHVLSTATDGVKKITVELQTGDK
ncbi:MAG: hypothetical protein J6Y49_00875 [Alphaproteobacteria bacterium]|nr:hypothetical protein [Alphaproteobacteria bacterium]